MDKTVDTDNIRLLCTFYKYMYILYIVQNYYSYIFVKLYSTPFM